MSSTIKYFAWIYFRALLWVAVCALLLWRSTGNGKIAKAYLGAHLAALGFGVLVDVFIVNFTPPSARTINVMQWVFTFPIVIFTVISLWICNWEKDVKIPDVLVTTVPIAMWGFLVIFGWQRMFDCHVLGAWFASAAAGGVDLFVRYGPPWAKRKPFSARLVGYVLIVMTVYLLLPKTELY